MALSILPVCLLLVTIHSSWFTAGVDDTGMCGIEDERATMPFRIDVAPLDDIGNAAQWVTVSGNAVGHGDGTALAVRVHPDRVAIIRAGTEVGQLPLSPVDRYSFAIVPQKTFVPTEGETEMTLCDLQPDPNKANYCPSGVGGPNTLSLLDKNGLPRPAAGQQAVLQFSEGAYVEGVIRFELTSNPMTIASRKPRAP